MYIYAFLCTVIMQLTACLINVWPEVGPYHLSCLVGNDWRMQTYWAGPGCMCEQGGTEYPMTYFDQTVCLYVPLLHICSHFCVFCCSINENTHHLMFSGSCCNIVESTTYLKLMRNKSFLMLLPLCEYRVWGDLGAADAHSGVEWMSKLMGTWP